MVLSGEGLVAEGALERPRPAVEGKVVFEVVGVEEAGRTVGAGVGALARVLPHVDLQLIVPEEDKRWRTRSEQIAANDSDSRRAALPTG